MKPKMSIFAPGGGRLLLLAIAVAFVAMWAALDGIPQARAARRSFGQLRLPPPQTEGKVSLEKVLSRRRSVRRFRPGSLTLGQIGQLMWAAQGVTDRIGGLRTAPSAGATYPLEIYALTADGLFHYLPSLHRLDQLDVKDLRRDLARAAVTQMWIADAPLNIVIAAVFKRTSKKYGERAVRYVHLEAGHAAQNVLLQAVALDLGACCVGAFYDDQVKRLLNLPDDQEPLYIIAVGRPRPGTLGRRIIR